MARKKKTKSQIEYEKARASLRGQISRAYKAGYKVTSMPGAVGKGASYKEYRAATKQLQELKKLQTRLTRESKGYGESKESKKNRQKQIQRRQELRESRERQTKEKYQRYVEAFFARVNEIPDIPRKKTPGDKEGREVIYEMVQDALEQTGYDYELIAGMIEEGYNNGMRLNEHGLWYRDIASEWVIRLLDYLGMVPSDDVNSMLSEMAEAETGESYTDEGLWY